MLHWTSWFLMAELKQSWQCWHSYIAERLWKTLFNQCQLSIHVWNSMRGKPVTLNTSWFNCFLQLVCNAGHYGMNGSCELCPGNTIKPTVGDAVNCSSTCEEMLTVANSNHTDCGKWNLMQGCIFAKIKSTKIDCFKIFDLNNTTFLYCYNCFQFVERGTHTMTQLVFLVWSQLMVQLVVSWWMTTPVLV